MFLRPVRLAGLVGNRGNEIIVLSLCDKLQDDFMGNMRNRISGRSLGILLAAWTIVSSPLSVSGETGVDVLNPQAKGYMERAGLMCADGNYNGAMDQLRRMTEMTPDLRGNEEALLLLARACYGNGSADLERSADLFLSLFPASPQAGEIHRLKGDFYFFNGKFARALAEYAAGGTEGLSPAERNRYLYRESLCRLKSGLVAEAEAGFRRLRGTSAYGRPAQFYLSYIDYLKGDYDAALEGFRKADGKVPGVKGEGDLYPDLLNGAPYIAQIYFKRGDWESAREIAESQLDGEAGFRPELLRIAGESAFRLGDVKAAASLLRRYLSTPDTAYAPGALYAMGSILYDEGKYDEAANLFSQVTDEGNEISQGAYLYLGQCAVNDGDFSEAAIDFERAYRLGFDAKVSETALYNYVAARTSGGRIPFGSSVGMMEDFLKAFPSSKYRESVQRYLASAYFNEKEYGKALANIEKIARPDRETMQLKQKALYELGVESASASRWKEAASYMSRCAALGQYDRKIASQAKLWEGEALYGAGDFSGALRAYESYLSGSEKGTDRALGVYGLAYALYMQDKFGAALPYFREASKLTGLPADLRSDALVRSGDCSYYTGDYSSAAKIFAEASGITSDKAYVMMRKAMMDGLLGNRNAKIKGLEEMTSGYPSSRWTPSALCELGATYAEAGRTKDAEKIYRRMTENYPESPEARKGLLLLGGLYVADSSPDKGAECYETLIRRWPKSEEAVAANEELRGIYARKGDLDAYLKFIKSIPGAPMPDLLAIEKAAFDAAESPWLDNISSTSRLERFLNDYPDSRYVPAALLDLALAAEDAGDAAKSLGYLDRLLGGYRDSAQTPEAMSMKARLLEENYPDRKSETLAAYRELEKQGGAAFAPEAAAGLARLSDSPAEKLLYAEKALSSRDLDEDMREELLYSKGVALSGLGRGAEAEVILKRLAGNTASLPGAKANVALGELYLASGNPGKAVELLSSFTEGGTPHQYWLARAYITLADAYTSQGKKGTANEYLKSLRDNYPGNEADIQEMIDSRLKKLK